MKLPDKLKSTKLNHDNIYHPVYDIKQLWNDMKRRKKDVFQIFLAIGITIAIIAIIMLALITFTMDCSKLTTNINQELNKTGLNQKIIDMIKQGKNCGMSLYYNFTSLNDSQINFLEGCKGCHIKVIPTTFGQVLNSSSLPSLK